MSSNPHHPYSPRFAEHYWSGGADEKSHVFLSGNHLPQRFAALAPAASFTVAELGFGTALTCLLTAHLWQESLAQNSTNHLHYISYEVDPLSATSLVPIHAAFPKRLHPLSASLLNLYHPQSGWNTLTLTPNITLHLYVGDATQGLATHPMPADAWFLDGFSPTNNPELWTPDLFTRVAARTNPHGTAATYSVARRVRDALTTAGFAVTQVPGFPPKGRVLQARKIP